LTFIRRPLRPRRDGLRYLPLSRSSRQPRIVQQLVALSVLVVAVA
jgi:hypothetical protein